MSKEYTFSVMPSVSISRSRFARKSQHKTSFNLGQLIPIYCDEVLPGDTMSMDMAALVRMSTPIAPIMDNIFMDYFAFFCPNRLVFDKWKELMGENNTSAGIPSTTYSVPYISFPSGGGTIESGSYADYLGLPVGVSFTSGTNGTKISALPFRCIPLIYNEYFRDQNLIAPIGISKGTQNSVLTGESGYTGSEFAFKANKILKVAKLSDYFTRALPYAQKGAAVTIPMGTTAPVVVGSSVHSLGGNLKFGTGTGGTSTFGSDWSLAVGSSGGVFADNSSAVGVTQGNITGANLVADLSQATAATINQLRYAFQLQKLLEKDALYGSRYFEILAAHFGVISPDARLQRPEYLGGWRQRINIDQVLSTTGYDDSSNTDLGKPGANSVSGGKNSIFTKSFVEHGYVFIFAAARHDQTYAQGINRMWSKLSRYDFYFPVFANLGAQDIKLKEIYAQGTSADENVFGYQEAWAEYRYKPSIATGLLNPNVANSLDYWTLTNKFAAAPTLGQTFIEQSRDNIQRALATGSTGPDFICDFYFENVCVRPMPMYSIPGLIDHH